MHDKIKITFADIPEIVVPLVGVKLNIHYNAANSLLNLYVTEIAENIIDRCTLENNDRHLNVRMLMKSYVSLSFHKK